MLAMPTSLTSKAPSMAMGDQFQEENEEGDDVCLISLTKRIFIYCVSYFLEKIGGQKQIIEKEIEKVDAIECG